MIIIPEKKIIFHHIPKTAGTSISHYLKNIRELKVLSNGNQHEPLKYWYDKKYDDFKILTVIRHPYERVVSLYVFIKHLLYEPKNEDRYLEKLRIDFSKWIKYILLKKEPDVYFHPRVSISESIFIDKKILDNLVIIRFENLEEQFYKFLSDNNIGINKKLTHVHKNPKYNWEEFYTTEIKNIIYKWDKIAIDTFYPELKE